MRIKYCFFIGLLLHYAAINAARFIYVSRNNVTLFADGTVESTEFYRITKNGKKTVVTNATPVKATTDRSKYLLLGVEENLNGVKNSFFGREIINGISGFSDNLALILSQCGLTFKDFIILQQKRYDLMNAAEKAHIDAIRNSIPMPDANTLLQKVIPKSQISKYTSGEYTQIGGFISTAKDAKHLMTFEDVYHGMRLDYPGTQFNLSDGSFGLIRYKTANPNLIIPKLPQVTGDLPYTGNGFTGGNKNRLGAPEWKSPYNTPADGSELWEVFSDGTEVLKAKFSTVQNKFIPIL